MDGTRSGWKPLLDELATRLLFEARTIGLLTSELEHLHDTTVVAVAHSTEGELVPKGRISRKRVSGATCFVDIVSVLDFVGFGHKSRELSCCRKGEFLVALT